MKKIIPFLLVTTLAACGQSEAPQKAADSEASIPTVEELAANPDRLKELRQQCKTDRRSQEHTSELQSLMRISYAVFCLKKKTNTPNVSRNTTTISYNQLEKQQNS